MPVTISETTAKMCTACLRPVGQRTASVRGRVETAFVRAKPCGRSQSPPIFDARKLDGKKKDAKAHVQRD